jgi:tRNA (adenine22-N1)-methyltransferase
MEKIRLTPRLLAVGELVPPGARAADVGTDHGYLPVWLRQQGICETVIASDIAPGPLEAARASALRYGAEGIEFRLCPGLEGIRPEEADAVVLAGMSGETMAGILTDADWDWTGKRLILQPMTKRAELLAWIYDHGLHIREEKPVTERGRLYWVLCAEAGREPMPRPAHLWAGFTETEYARRLRRQLERSLTGQRKARTPDPEELRRTEELLEDMKDAYGW